mgnify:CR=1 FL=1
MKSGCCACSSATNGFREYWNASRDLNVMNGCHAPTYGWNGWCVTCDMTKRSVKNATDEMYVLPLRPRLISRLKPA